MKSTTPIPLPPGGIRLLVVITLLAALAHFVSVPPSARAAGFDLTGSCPGGVGDATALVAALNAANGNGEADTITLAAGCVYTLAAFDNISDGPNGLPVITGPITITGNGAVIGRDNIAPDFRIFQVGGGGNLTLNDLTVQAGRADEGAGIYNNGGTLTLTGVTVRDNAALFFGGGIVNLGTMNIANSTVTANSANSSAGIYNEGPLTLSNSTVSRNTATRDGGGMTNYDDTTITNCTIADNQAQGTAGDGRGGGIEHRRGNLQITNSTLSSNTGESAGAIHYFGDGGGGNIALTISHVTLFGNSSGINLEGMPGDEIRYQNSIIAGNTDFDCAVMDGSFISLGYNLVGSAGGCPGSATGDQSTTNAQLAVLADNGGATQTHALLPASPAYNAIPAANCAAAADQRGVTRPQGPNCDTGAFELQQSYTLTVTRNGTGSGTVTGNPAGINCGGDCSEAYTQNTVVTLTAGPAAGSTFVGWSGDPDCADGQVTMTADMTCTATFNAQAVPQSYTLTVTRNGTGSGTVTGNPAGINCGGDCSEAYTQNTVVTLTAGPAAGSTFVGWSGDPDCADGQVTMTADMTCTATFNAQASPPTGSGKDDDDDDDDVPPPVSPPAPGGQVFDCWPWEIIIPALVVPDAGTICRPSLGQPLPAPSTFRYLEHSTDVVVTDAAGSPVTTFASAPLKICFRYTQPELDAVHGDAAQFLIQTYKDGVWESLTTTPEGDSGINVLGRVCAPVNHLSLFALFAEDDNDQTTVEIATTNNPLAAVATLPETGTRPPDSNRPWLVIGMIGLAGVVGAWMFKRRR